MKVSAECMHCLVKRQAENIKKYPPTGLVPSGGSYYNVYKVAPA